MNPKTILIIVMLFMTSIVLVSTAATSTPSVSVNAPDNVNTDFDVVIEIENVVDLDSGQFDLHFDPDRVSVKSIDDGSINGTAIPIDDWAVDKGIVTVLVNLPGITGVSGSGSLAVIHFNTIEPGECSMQISDGLLVDITAGKIAANWDGTEDAPVHTVNTTTTTAKEDIVKQPGFSVMLCICVLAAVAFVLGKRDE